MRNIEKLIRDYCIEHNIKITHFALMVGRSKQTVYSWFRGGFPPPKKLASIADKLGVRVDELFD